MVKTTKDSFMRKVQKTDGCWIWTGHRNKTGYGQIGYNGKVYYAHRLMWEWQYGEIPEGYYVCHHCDNRACVNPDHLFLGTPLDNQRDSLHKGRNYRGERHYMTNLSAADVMAIRYLWAGRIPGKDIATMFGVLPSAVSNILTRRNWKHLP